MESEAQASPHWFILAFSFVGAAAFLFFAVDLIVHAVSGHGGHAGNILRVGLAIIFLFLGFFLVAVGALYRMSFDEEHGDEFR
jgi:hypothetical protein